MTTSRTRRVLARLHDLPLSRRAVAALAAAVVVATGAAVGFAVALEDVTGHNGLATSDRAHLRWFTDHRTGALTNLAKLVTDLGSVGALALLAIVAGAVLWRRGAPLVLAATPALSLGLAGGLAAVAKVLVDRARPPVALHLVAESNASFPSGHATDSTAVLVALAIVTAATLLRRPQVRVALVAASGLLAGAIGWSRLELGVHWPTDVLAGWMLGLFVAITTSTAAALIVHLRPPSAQATTWDRFRAWALRLLTTHRVPGSQRTA